LNRFIQAFDSKARSREDETEQTAVYTILAKAMGTRLGELHALLAKPNENEAFSAEKVTAKDAASWAEGAIAQINAAIDVLAAIQGTISPEVKASVDFVLKQKSKFGALVQRLAKAGIGSLRTRIHGDFHLGQILVVTNDAYLIDFEGEPSKPLNVRRSKQSPMRDVAGLLRSFHYAASAADIAYSAGPSVQNNDHKKVLSRFVNDVSEHFLTAYRKVEASSSPKWSGEGNAESALLDLFLLEKSAYEICYEAANRPAWLSIPLSGFVDIIKRVLELTSEAEHA
jgi:maltose alpha-D-glucosyltransferase/alpha-amylase